jgi:hypothetical protein
VVCEGEEDIFKGLAEAEFLQNGFHCSFLAAPGSAVTSPSILVHAGNINVGILAVYRDGVSINSMPTPGRPKQRQHQFILNQLDSAFHAARVFHYNLPTHYLVWAIALEQGETYTLKEALSRVGGYPIPKHAGSCLSGAQKLGMVSHVGKHFQLTDLGASLKMMMPKSLEEWAAIHRGLVTRKHTTLQKLSAISAAALRMILLHDPFVKLVIEGLRSFKGNKSDFLQLARKCESIDRARAQVFFLNPEKAGNVMGDRGMIDWSEVTNEHFRSGILIQYKNILRHAGILTPFARGGVSTRGFKPEEDIWQLNKF